MFVDRPLHNACSSGSLSLCCYWVSVNASLLPTGLSRVPDHLPDHEAWWVCRWMRRKMRCRRKIRRDAGEECSSYPISWAFVSLTACTKKNFIYTMYKTCRFLIRCLFFAVFSIVCFMHFINHGLYHDVMWLLILSVVTKSVSSSVSG